MEGFALSVMFPLWSYKSELLTPKPKHNRTILHKVTILAKAINKDKPSCPLAYCPPGRVSSVGDYPGTPSSSVYQVTHGTAFQAAECYVQQVSCES